MAEDLGLPREDSGWDSEGVAWRSQHKMRQCGPYRVKRRGFREGLGWEKGHWCAEGDPRWVEEAWSAVTRHWVRVQGMVNGEKGVWNE